MRHISQRLRRRRRERDSRLSDSGRAGCCSRVLARPNAFRHEQQEAAMTERAWPFNVRVVRRGNGAAIGSALAPSYLLTGGNGQFQFKRRRLDEIQ